VKNSNPNEIVLDLDQIIFFTKENLKLILLNATFFLLLSNILIYAYYSSLFKSTIKVSFPSINNIVQVNRDNLARSLRYDSRFLDEITSNIKSNNIAGIKETLKYNTYFDLNTAVITAKCKSISDCNEIIDLSSTALSQYFNISYNHRINNYSKLLANYSELINSSGYKKKSSSKPEDNNYLPALNVSLGYYLDKIDKINEILESPNTYPSQTYSKESSNEWSNKINSLIPLQLLLGLLYGLLFSWFYIRRKCGR
jgi:hypothetical protein